VGILSVPLPSVHVGKEKGVEADMGIEMATIAAPTLSFVDELPKDVVKPAAAGSTRLWTGSKVVLIEASRVG
jgi:hypothetical protein